MGRFKDLEVCTAAGQIRIVSFKNFLSLIRFRNWPKHQNYVEWEIYGRFLYYHPAIIFPYVTKTAGFFEEFRIKPEDFMKHVDIVDVTIDGDLESMLHDMANRSACEMGDPTHLFRLGTRLWGMANPKDFEIHTNGTGSVLANYRPKKTVVWRILK